MDTATLHPMMVHFPIALIIVGFLFATLEMFFVKCRKTQCTLKVTYWLLSLGTLSAIAAVLTGVIFTTMQSSILLPDHRTMAFATLAVALVAAALYIYYIYKAPESKILHWVAYLVYFGAVVLVSVTGHYGGMMVY
ncbi:MAG: DUF2231 domain-containing protein [Mucinivorans sp.]